MPFPSSGLTLLLPRCRMKLTIDTNCINGYGRLPAMNIIERWAAEGKLALLASWRLRYEARHSEGARKKAGAMRFIGEPLVYGCSFFDAGAYYSENAEPSFEGLASVLFPRRKAETLSENQLCDVMHLLSHVDGGG